RSAGRVFPPDIHLAGRQSRPASSAGAGRAFERKIDALPRPRIKNGFALAAVETEFAVIAIDGDFHGANARNVYLKKSSSSESPPSSSKSYLSSASIFASSIPFCSLTSYVLSGLSVSPCIFRVRKSQAHR